MIPKQSLYHIKVIGTISSVFLLGKQKYNVVGLGLQIFIIIEGRGRKYMILNSYLVVAIVLKQEFIDRLG